MLVMRVRLPELLEKNGTGHAVTAYRLAKSSGKRIGLTTVYRLIGKRGHVRYLDAKMLDALCDVLHVSPADLLARDDPPPPAEKKSRRRKAAA